ncbi:MAG TPA: FtsX-like permease family protein [Hyphomonadaceae bacterium]|jgi:putative ABC transport system permease protein|nr:FtsX-like permease family protein [Hyphomonadaceae bacterium]
MILHWLSTAWRSLIANPLFSLITIASLSIGCCGAVLAGSNIVQHLSFERWVPDAQNIAKVTMLVKEGLIEDAMETGGAERPDGVYAAGLAAPSLYSALDAKRFSQVRAHTVVFPGRLTFKDASPDHPPKVISVEPNFFDVFEFPVASGNAAETLATPGRAVITESFARRLFGTTDAVGKALPLVAGTVQVGAVLHDLPAATQFDFDVIAGPRAATRGQNVSMIGIAGPRNADWMTVIHGSQFVRFAPGFTFESGAPVLEDGFTKVVQTGNGMAPDGAERSQVTKVTLVPLLDLHLAGPQNTGLPSSGDMLLLATLGGAAIALLGVSTFNYIILSLARSLRRRKEVAMRKVLGASKGALVQHYLTEAAVVAAISLGIGFGLAELLQPWFARALAQPDGLVAIYDRWFLGIGGVALIFLVLAVGFYPAFYLAGVRPRAGLENSGGDSLGPIGRTVTSVLLALQVGAASVLLTLAFTMAAQVRFVTQRPLGYTTENMYLMNNGCVQVTHPPGGGTRVTASGTIELAQCRAQRLANVRALPGVDAASAVAGVIADPDVIETSEFSLEGVDLTAGKTSTLNTDTDFLPMVGAKLLAGRFFDANSAYDRRYIDNFTGLVRPPDGHIPVIATRAILPMIGAETPEAAIGMRVGPRGAGIFEIVGIVEDWQQRSLRYKATPLVFLPGVDELSPILSIKPENLAAVTERIRAVPPLAGDGVPEPKLTPLSEAFERAYAGDRRLMLAVLGFSGIAILVACLGVYGLTAFDMRRRVREIGIRKALGAAPAKVAGMVLGRQVLFAAIASLASWPVGLWLSSAWLQLYAYRTELGLLALPLASVIVIAFAALAVGLNTARAAAIRPSFALRAAA